MTSQWAQKNIAKAFSLDNVNLKGPNPVTSNGYAYYEFHAKEQSQYVFKAPLKG